PPEMPFLTFYKRCSSLNCAQCTHLTSLQLNVNTQSLICLQRDAFFDRRLESLLRKGESVGSNLQQRSVVITLVTSGNSSFLASVYFGNRHCDACHETSAWVFNSANYVRLV